MSVVEGSEAASLARASRVLSECFIYIYETIREGPMSRAFQTFLQDFVFLIQRPMAAHLARPDRTDNRSPIAPSHVSQKIRASRLWRDTIFPALKDAHLLSDRSYLSGKPRLNIVRKFSVQLPIGRLGAAEHQGSVCQPDRIAHVEQLERRRASVSPEPPQEHRASYQFVIQDSAILS